MRIKSRIDFETLLLGSSLAILSIGLPQVKAFSLERSIIGFLLIAILTIFLLLKNSKIPKPLFESYILVFGIFVSFFAGVVFYGDPINALKPLLLYILAITLVGFVVFSYSRENRDVKNLIYIFVLFSIASAIYSLLFYAMYLLGIADFGQNKTGKYQYYSFFVGNYVLGPVVKGPLIFDSLPRTGGFFSNPNGAGLAYAVSIIWLSQIRIFKKYTHYLALLSLFSSLILTWSRGAWLFLAIAGVTLFFVFYKDKKYCVPYLVMLFTLLFSLLFAQLSFLLYSPIEYDFHSDNKLLNIIRFSDGLSERGAIWSQFSSYFANNPFFGNGFSSSSLILENLGFDVGVHSLYIAVLVEVGIVGGFVFFLLVFYSIIIWVKNRKWSDNSSFFTFPVVLGLLFHALFEGSIFIFNWISILFFVSVFHLYLDGTSNPRLSR